MSILYAGSRAMKRDVTKTGIRTNQGLMDDAVSYAKRYIANNYIDQSRQIGIDYLLGKRKSLFEKQSLTKQDIANMEKVEICEIKDENAGSNNKQQQEKKLRSLASTIIGAASLIVLALL